MNLKNIKDLKDLPALPPEKPFIVTGAPFGLSWRFTFGKYKTQRLEDVIDTDAEYVGWCLDNVVGFQITVTAALYLVDVETGDIP